MPIYEYQCQACRHEFEAMQKMADAALSECPACHQLSLRKKISAVGFRLSGSGWYETDFKKSGNKKNLVGEGGGEKSADTKPDAPTKEASTTNTKSDSAKPASAPAPSSDK